MAGAGHSGSAQTEGNPGVVHHPARRWHRDLGAERRLPDRTINRAIDQGIPVITWDSDAPKSKRIAFYGVDDFESGKILGQEAIKLLNGKGTVAIITSFGATNLQRRLDGVARRSPRLRD